LPAKRDIFQPVLASLCTENVALPTALNCAVTPADVQRVSQKYMRNIRFVVLGNPAQIDKNVFIGQAGL